MATEKLAEMTPALTIRYLKHSDKLTRDHAARIGRVTAAWADFEQLMNSTTWALVNHRNVEAVACLTAQIENYGRKLDAIIAIFGTRGCQEPILKKLRSFSEWVGNLGRMRNRIVHDTWTSVKETGEAYRLEITAAKTLVFTRKPISAAEMKKCLSDIRKAKRAFEYLVTAAFKDPLVRASFRKEQHEERSRPSTLVRPRRSYATRDHAPDKPLRLPKSLQWK